MTEIRHDLVEANGIRLHVARCGDPRGRPLVLLHGWPEFWLTWEPLMQRLAGRFLLIAPDLRGFGDSDKPDPRPTDRATAAVHAEDLVALLDALGLPRVGVVTHDIGAAVMQVAARRAPDRFAGLLTFDCPYPGMGARFAAPDHLTEIWYQSFHQLPMAAEVVGASREGARAYFSHFLRHWSAGNPHAFDPVLEAWVDNFLKPGNLQGGFNWYIGAWPSRLAVIKGEVPPQPRITVPTCVRWGALDPILKAEWRDRLDEHFADLDAAAFPGVGHFPHREDPDRTAAEVLAFFDRVWPAA
jgi:pimeloyl-ACP methyl ester carboxylesterase